MLVILIPQVNKMYQSLTETISKISTYGKKAGYTAHDLSGGTIQSKSLATPKASGQAFDAFHKKLTSLGYKVTEGSEFSTENHFNRSYHHPDRPSEVVHFTCTHSNRAENVKDGAAFVASK